MWSDVKQRGLRTEERESNAVKDAEQQFAGLCQRIVRGELPSARLSHCLHLGFVLVGGKSWLCALEREFVSQFWKMFFVRDNKMLQAKTKQVNREPLPMLVLNWVDGVDGVFFAAYVDI